MPLLTSPVFSALKVIFTPLLSVGFTSSRLPLSKPLKGVEMIAVLTVDVGCGVCRHAGCLTGLMKILVEQRTDHASFVCVGNVHVSVVKYSDLACLTLPKGLRDNRLCHSRDLLSG